MSRVPVYHSACTIRQVHASVCDAEPSTMSECSKVMCMAHTATTNVPQEACTVVAQEACNAVQKKQQLLRQLAQYQEIDTGLGLTKFSRAW
jgi:hypothetical protein